MTDVSIHIDFDIVSCVIHFLQMDDNADVQLQAARAITNITLSNTSDHISSVVEAGAIPILIRQLSSPNEEISATVAWALGNIAANRLEYRDMMLADGALPALLQAVEDFKEKSKHTVLRFPHEDVNEQAVLIIGNTVVNDLIERDGFYLPTEDFNELSKVETVKKVLYAISIFFALLPFPDIDVVQSVFPVLARLLLSEDLEIIENACLALCHISYGSEIYIRSIVASDRSIIPRFIELLEHGSPEVTETVLTIIGNIMTGDNLYTKMILHCNGLPALFRLLDHTSESIRDAVCLAISNITAGTTK